MHNPPNTVNPRHNDGEALFQDLVKGRFNINLETQHGPFHRLKSLVVNSDHGILSHLLCLMDMLLICLSLPNLSTLGLSFMHLNGPESHNSLPKYTVLDIVKTLTAVHLHETQLPILLVQQLLQHTPMLNSYSFVTINPVHAMSPSDLHRSRTALESIHSTLASLTVRVQPYDRQFGRRSTRPGDSLSWQIRLCEIFYGLEPFPCFSAKVTYGSTMNVTSPLPFHII